MTETMVEGVGRALSHPRPCTATALSCPRCEGAPLEVFRRYELVTAIELRWCPRCHGFWAAGDALARGVADPYADHPALRAMPFPDRCKSCLGYFNPEGACRKCGQSRPVAACPCCLQPLQAAKKGAIHLDMCEPCMGTWFDIGEITAAFALGPVQGMAASTVADDGPSDADVFKQALNVLLSLFLPIRL